MWNIYAENSCRHEYLSQRLKMMSCVSMKTNIEAFFYNWINMKTIRFFYGDINNNFDFLSEEHINNVVTMSIWVEIRSRCVVCRMCGKRRP